MFDWGPSSLTYTYDPSSNFMLYTYCMMEWDGICMSVCLSQGEDARCAMMLYRRQYRVWETQLKEGKHGRGIGATRQSVGGLGTGASASVSAVGQANQADPTGVTGSHTASGCGVKRAHSDEQGAAETMADADELKLAMTSESGEPPDSADGQNRDNLSISAGNSTGSDSSSPFALAISKAMGVGKAAVTTSSGSGTSSKRPRTHGGSSSGMFASCVDSSSLLLRGVETCVGADTATGAAASCSAGSGDRDTTAGRGRGKSGGGGPKSISEADQEMRVRKKKQGLLQGLRKKQ